MADNCSSNENQSYARIAGSSIYLEPKIIIIESIHFSHIGEQITAKGVIISLSNNPMIGNSVANQKFNIKSIINMTTIT